MLCFEKMSNHEELSQVRRFQKKRALTLTIRRGLGTAVDQRKQLRRKLKFIFEKRLTSSPPSPEISTSTF